MLFNQIFIISVGKEVLYQIFGIIAGTEKHFQNIPNKSAQSLKLQ